MNERQVANKALELADELETMRKQIWYDTNHDICVFMDETLDASSQMLRSQEKYINLLHKLLNANGIGVGRNLLTGEVIPFEVEDEQ